MKCPSCGAEIGNDKFCQYCGTQIPYNMKREQEQLNKQGCPKCGSSNIDFKRENQGEVRGKNAKRIIHRTVGYCKDCGYTWYPNVSNEVPKQNSNMVLWVLGWIFFFPAPVMVLIWRKKNTWDIKVKIAVTVVFWILVFVIGSSGNKDGESNTKNNNATTEESKANQGENEKTSIYQDAEIIDMMSGSGTQKIGTESVVRAKQSDCTEEALLDWYFNFVKKNDDCKCHVIVYSDIPNKGVYTGGMGFIQKDITLVPDEDGTYSMGDDAGSTYYTVDENANKLNVMASMADSSVVDGVKEQVDAAIPNEYKKGDLYTVDVAGEPGELECDLILINEEFADADCQSIAVDLARKVKDLDLGIGYFCISFQTNDYDLVAISNMDDLSSHEADEITTKEF